MFVVVVESGSNLNHIHLSTCIYMPFSGKALIFVVSVFFEGYRYDGDNTQMGFVWWSAHALADLKITQQVILSIQTLLWPQLAVPKHSTSGRYANIYHQWTSSGVKVDMPNSVAFRNQTPKFRCYAVRCAVRFVQRLSIIVFVYVFTYRVFSPQQGLSKDFV